MKILELEVKGVFPFKHAKLDLDYEGVTVIRGLNKDDGPKATNAAGKSRLVSAFAELVLDEGPTGKEDNAKVKNAKVKRKAKKSSIRVKFQRGKHTYDVTKITGKSKKYEIIKDGKSTDVRTVKYSQEKVKSLFGLTTEDQFYSRFYLDGTIPHPLLIGSAARRQEFIVDLFELKNIDHVRKLLNAELTAIGKKAVEYRTIRSTMQELKDDLAEKDKRREVAARLEELKAKQERLSKSLQESQHVSQLLTFERQNAPLLERYAKLDLHGRELPEEMKRVRKKIAEINSTREAYHDWLSYDKHYEMWASAYAPIKKKLKELGCDADEVRIKAKEAAVAKAKLAAIKDESREAGPEPETVDKPKYEMDECKVQVRMGRDQLDRAKNLKKGVCPTCGSHVKPQPIETLEAELTKWVKRINQCEAYERYTQKYTTWKERRKTERENQAKVLELEAETKALGKYSWVATLLEDVSERPSKPQSDRPADFDEKKLEKLQRRYESLKQVSEVWETIQSLEELDDEQRQKAKDAEKHVKRLNEVMAEINQHTTWKVRQDEILTRLRSLKVQADDLHEECKDEKLLRALVGSYSNTGLKKFMIERYSKLLEQQVNKYRRMFFSEDYEFEFHYDSGLKVLAHRTYGKRVETSDVRKLSGAEKRFFTLLLVVATNTMLPLKKRINVLVLDEPESQMGPPAIERFVKTLSILRKLVPHIVIVTPKPDLEIPDSRNYTVIKHHGVSTLIQDRVGRKA